MNQEEKKKKKKKEFFNKKETFNSDVFRAKCIFEDNWNGFERFYDFSKDVILSKQTFHSVL